MKTSARNNRQARVRVRETRTPITTYWPFRRDPWPDVFFKSKWFAPVYPFDRYQHPFGRPRKRKWITVTLENAYLRVVVLPELGGHVWQMYEKISRRHLLYANDAIKPTHIGFRNAWCGIGMEFNFPVAHSLLTIDPLPYRIERHEDGSASVVTWHRDRPSGLEMMLRLRLHPARRDLQITAQMYNPSPVRKPYDYWTNAAVPARPDLEFIYPTRWMQAHGSPKMYDWPVVDGFDLRFQKNYQRTVSLFAWDAEPPFFGCWWAEGDVGLAHVGDSRVTPGKKLFNWGKRASAWLPAFTDKAGPYVEIQSGRFRTQADYHWLQPGQADVLQEAWYGFSALGGLSWAGPDLALHVQTDADDGRPATKAVLRVHAVRDIRHASLTVRADDKRVWERRAELAASKPRRFTISLPRPARNRLTVQVRDADGELLGEHTVPLGPQRRPARPKATVEKAALMFESLSHLDAEGRARIGQISELQNFWPRAREAYRSALQADPACSEALCGMAGLALRDGNFAEAARYARRLIEAASGTRQLAGWYFLGVAELHRGRDRKALEALQAAQKHPKWGQMARLFAVMAEARLGRHQEALRRLARLREPVASMPLARWLRAALAGYPDAADPAGGWNVPADAELIDLALERSIWALRIGNPALAEQILQNLLQRIGKDCEEPLVWYLLGYLHHQQGRSSAAKDSLRRAGRLNLNHILPRQPEWTDVLHWALATNKTDRKPHAYLGPMEYWLSLHDEAIEHWRKLARADSDIDAGVTYTLAMAAWETRNDTSGAVRLLSAALRKNPKEARLYFILDDVLKESRKNALRGRWLRRAMQTVGPKDDIVERYCHWLINTRRFGEAIETLRGHKFAPAHGWWLRRRLWLLAHQLWAEEELRRGNLQRAYELGIEGANPPMSLGEDDMAMPIAAPALIVAAEAAERMGQKARSLELCREALERARRGHVFPPYCEVFRARALIRLKRKRAAERILRETSTEVLPRLADRRPWVDKAHFHYIYGLLLQAKGETKEARKHLAKARRLGVSWAELVGFGMKWGFN